MEAEFLVQILANLPNFAGFIMALVVMQRQNAALLDQIKEQNQQYTRLVAELVELLDKYLQSHPPRS